MTVAELSELIIFLIEKENEAQLWEVWLNKDTEKSFGDFKDEVTRQANGGAKVVKVDEDKIKRSVERASRYVTAKEVANG